MALDIQTFRTRALTAVVFAAVLLFGLLSGALPFFILFGVVTFIGANEYYQIQNKIAGKQGEEMEMHIYGLASVAFYFFVANNGRDVFIENKFLTIQFYIIPILVLTLFWLAMNKAAKPSLQLMYGYFYIPLSLGTLAQLYMMNTKFPLLLILLIWVNDTMQYIVGSLLGKTPMAPIISPKKTWEGTIGGSAICVLVAFIASFLIKDISRINWLLLGFCASVVGTLGDLLESKLKRTAQIKDSGTFMPGHGGVLDRFDSLLLASPVLWLLLKVLA